MIFVCMLDFSVNLIGIAKLDDLLDFGIGAIHQDQVLGLSLEEKELEGNTVHSGL